MRCGALCAVTRIDLDGEEWDVATCPRGHGEQWREEVGHEEGAARGAAASEPTQTNAGAPPAAPAPTRARQIPPRPRQKVRRRPPVR